MDLSIEDFKSIHGMISGPEMECATLREKLRRAEEELQRKTSECERLREELRCVKSASVQDANHSMREGYIVISLKKLRKFLTEIKETQLIGFIIFLLQKLLPKDADAATMKLIAETAPEGVRPDIAITAEGDVNVAGSYNHFQNNNNVNLQNP